MADITSVTHGNGMFVAVGQSGVAAYSSDGRIWHEWSTGQTAALNRVAWNGTAFLAGGNAGLLLKASPWAEWSVVPLPWGAYDHIFAIAGKGPGWVIGSTRSNSGENSMHSADGVTWAHGGGTYFVDMAAGAGQFVGTSTYGSLQISEDGVVWSQCQTSLAGNFIAIEWTGSEFVAMTAGRHLAVSVDGKRWEARGLMQDTEAGCWDGGQYAVVGNKGMIFTSPDGRTWTSEVNPDANDLMCVNFANGRFLAVGKEGVILCSLDGRNWQKAALPVGWDFYDVHWSGSAFWTVGEGGAVLTSADGLAWQITNPGTIDAVIWDGQRYLAFSGRTVIESQDGNSWSPVTGVPWPGNSTPPESKIHQIIWTGQYYVAVGEKRWIIRSSDGIQWTRGEIDGYPYTSFTFNSIAYSGSRFVAMAESSSEFIHSEDGLNWTRKTFAGAMTSTTKGVVWDGTRFVAIAANTVFTSPDGTAWTRIATITNGGQALRLQSIAWDGTRYLVAGIGGEAAIPSNGIIGTSANGITWTFLPVESGTSYSGVIADAGFGMALRSDGKVKRWNGTTWVLETPDLSGEPLALIKNGTSYAAFSRSGMVSTSAAAGSWQPGDRRVNGGINGMLRSIISANGVLVAGSQGWHGSQASILRSTDGRNWTKETFAGYQGPFVDPVWTGSEFLMVGKNHIYVSTDGTGWTPSQGMWDAGAIRSLALFGGKTVVAGSGIWIEDGSVFRQVQTSTSYHINALISNGSELLAIGYNQPMVSSDGEHWWGINPGSGSAGSLADVVHTPTGFYACGDYGQIQHSPDGKTWSRRTVTDMPRLNAMIQTDIGLVGVGIGFAISPDGQTWTCKSDSREFVGVAFGNGRIVATALNHAAVSTDGINWQVVTHNLRGGKVVWSGSEFVMMLEDRGMAVSSDGLTWKAVVIPGNLTGCAASPDAYIVSNSHGNIYRSTDGANWSMVLDSSDSAVKMRVVWSGSRFFIFGDYILTSTDGNAWTQRTRNHNDVVWTGARYVGVGNSGAIGVSTNGTAWSNVGSITTSRLNRVIWTGSGLIAVGANGTLITSPDGSTWSSGNSGTSKELVDVVVHNGMWIAVASDGSVVYETGGPAVPEGFLANGLLLDGSTLIAAGRAGRMANLVGNEWQEVSTPTSWDLRAICTTPAGLQACGVGNVILRRNQGEQWSAISSGLSSGGYIDIWVSGGELKVLTGGRTIASSSSGRVWYPQQQINSASVLRDVVEVSGQLFAVGDAGSIVAFKDGISTSAVSPTTSILRAVAAGNNRLVAVGGDGVILVSEAGPLIRQMDTDQDGLSDFLEWATGSDPETSSSSQLMFSRENDRMVFAYPRSLEAVEAGVTFTVEWSDDLIVWQTQGVLEMEVTPVDSSVQQITVEVPEGATGSRFVRLRVSDPP